ncbi:glycosyltransferase family 2 protein [Enterococcus casseliflavus]|uniref:glycosyltransferase family 2 protein n=1 Tax=Enterococcus casseliflavus TaxID=37734 RepID=UPI0025896DF3|nr:glycosyltransferase family 2 protein [uncultured Enterococcus sp.]
MNKIDMTVIILTKNEEKNLSDCLESLKDSFERVIIVDSYSEDETYSISQKYNCEFVQHAFVNYGEQFQWALEHLEIKTKWVFRLDADERLTEKSLDEIKFLANKHYEDNVNGIVFPLEVKFMGKRLRYGGTYPFKKLCIFKKDFAYMEKREMDEQIIITEGEIVEMKNVSLHEDFKSLTYWIDKHNWYATRAAKDFLNRAKKGDEYADLDRSAKIRRYVKYNIYYKLPSIIRTSSYFFYRYFIRLGFLDGYIGFLYNFLQAYWYRVLVDAKIYELQKTKEKYN